MRARVAIFASVVLCGNAIAEPTRYAVDGLPVGAKLNFDSTSYREFKCGPSAQFDGFTWCQKTRTDVGRRGPYVAGYSVLHSTDGNVSYVNRSQDAGFFNEAEAQADIKRYSRSIGEEPRIVKLPHRSGLPDGLIATWGAIALKPLDPQSIKTLAEGKSPKKGFLIDYLGDLTRSAREGLPIYRMDGGPGFVWAASFGLRGRGTLRVVAVDTSGFAPAPEQPPTAQSTAVGTAAANATESGQSIDTLQAEITTLNSKIAGLETAAAAGNAARSEAAQARADTELAQRAIETAAAEKAQLEGTIARLQTDRAAANAKAGWWQSAVPGVIGALLGVLTTSAFGFFMNRRKAYVSKQPVLQPAAEPIKVAAQSQNDTQPIDLSAQSQNGAPEIVPHVASPEIAATEAAVEVVSGEQVEATPTSTPSTASTAGDERRDAGAEISASRPS